MIFDGGGKVLPQLWDKRIFCGFKSLCTIPFVYKAFIAPAVIKIKLLINAILLEIIY